MSDLESTLIGTAIADRYRVDEVIGRGGLGIVFAGLHLSLSKPIAIKTLNIANGVSQEHKLRFQSEARNTSRLDHQNIVKVYDFGELPGGSSFIIMDLVTGENLESLITSEEIIDHQRVVSIFTQVCAGLGHAHKAGVVHRDLTPSNVMLTKTNTGEEVVKILDFGLSKTFGDASLAEQRLTVEGHVVGTCLYMSPEQCSDGDLDARSDIYSLACVLYEVLTGKVPLMGKSAISTLQMQINSDPLPFSQVSPERVIPADFEKLVFKAMSKNPKDRHQSVEEFAQDLRAIGAKLATGAEKKLTGNQKIEGKPTVNTSTIKMSPLAEPVPAEAPVTEKLTSPVAASKKSIMPGVLAGVGLLAVVAVVVMNSAHQTTATSTDPAKLPASATKDPANPAAVDAAGGAKSATPVAAKDDSKWRDFEKKGDSARKAGKFAESEKNYAMSLKELDKKKEADPKGEEKSHKEVIDRLVSLANICHKDGECDRAERLLIRSVEISRKVFGPESKEATRRVDDLAAFYLSMGEDKKADEVLKSYSSNKNFEPVKE